MCSMYWAGGDKAAACPQTAAQETFTSPKTSTAIVYLLADALGTTVRSNKTFLALNFFFFLSSSVDRRVTSEQTTVSLSNRRGSGCDLGVQQHASQQPQTRAVLYASSSPSTSSPSRTQTKKLAAEQISLHLYVKENTEQLQVLLQT